MFFIPLCSSFCCCKIVFLKTADFFEIFPFGVYLKPSQRVVSSLILAFWALIVADFS